MTRFVLNRHDPIFCPLCGRRGHAAYLDHTSENVVQITVLHDNPDRTQCATTLFHPTWGRSLRI